MLQTADIERIVTAAVHANLSSEAVVSASPEIDFEGEPVIRIKISLTPESTAAVTGEQALRTRVQTMRELRAAGESRLPVFEYAAAGS